MKKYLITSVSVGFCLLFLVGCSSEVNVEEHFELVRLGMTFDEVKSIMGYPHHIMYTDGRYILWYVLEDPSIPTPFIEREDTYQISFADGVECGFVISKRKQESRLPNRPVGK